MSAIHEASFALVEVFPGTSDSSEDTHYNGTFRDGDTVKALCVDEGRTIESGPSVGELDRSSGQWIRIQGSPGLTQYATAVYIQKRSISERAARLLITPP